MIDRMIAKALVESPKSVLLLGPRQTGKSTLIRQLKPDLEINLANRVEFLVFASNPGELQQRLAAVQNLDRMTVFIDEVQKLPHLLDTVQYLLDSTEWKDRLKFYLSGSSARKLKRGGANLLPGRIFIFQLGPLASCELRNLTEDERVLETGFLPEIFLSKNRTFQEKLLSSYTATYLAEEIQAESLTRNLEGFSRFLNVAAENSGKHLDFSKISSKAKVSRQSCFRFFEILEDTLIGQKILPCSFIEKADLVKHPKFYFFDVGVLNAALGNFTASGDRKGLLFEHLIFNQLSQSASAKDKKIEISSFRTRGGLEIDFIVKLDRKVWAVEVKATHQISPSDLAGVQQFAKYHPEPYQPVIATLGGHPKKIGHVWILPWQKLLDEMGL